MEFANKEYLLLLLLLLKLGVVVERNLELLLVVAAHDGDLHGVADVV